MRMLHAPGVAWVGAARPCGPVVPAAALSLLPPVTGSDTCCETGAAPSVPTSCPTAYSVPCCWVKRSTVNVPVNGVPFSATPVTMAGAAVTRARGIF